LAWRVVGRILINPENLNKNRKMLVYEWSTNPKEVYKPWKVFQTQENLLWPKKVYLRKLIVTHMVCKGKRCVSGKHLPEDSRVYKWIKVNKKLIINFRLID